MLYREIIAVCSQIHTKHINTLCGQKVKLFDLLAKELRKATISFERTVFHEIWYSKIFFSKMCRENSSFFKNPTRMTGTFTWRAMCIDDIPSDSS